MCSLMYSCADHGFCIIKGLFVLVEWFLMEVVKPVMLFLEFLKKIFSPITVCQSGCGAIWKVLNIKPVSKLEDISTPMTTPNTCSNFKHIEDYYYVTYEGYEGFELSGAGRVEFLG